MCAAGRTRRRGTPVLQPRRPGRARKAYRPTHMQARLRSIQLAVALLASRRVECAIHDRLDSLGRECCGEDLFVQAILVLSGEVGVGAYVVTNALAEDEVGDLALRNSGFVQGALSQPVAGDSVLREQLARLEAEMVGNRRLQ